HEDETANEFIGNCVNLAQRAVFFPIRLAVLLARGSALMKLH
ncbi:hypothetical protein D1AOALGA4SA_9117, partial [Olavius algarvensis Delta 1 endosymbiont]